MINAFPIRSFHLLGASQLGGCLFGLIGMLFVWAFVPAIAWAGRPAILLGVPKIETEGFNRDALNGAMTFQRLQGVKVDILTREETAAGISDSHTMIEKAVSLGADPVVGVGFFFRDAIQAAARKHPGVRFMLIDAAATGPNIASVVFREEEGSFLVGALAALASRSGTVGFVGGWDIPLIRKFGCAYAQGGRHVAPKLRVLSLMNGDTVAAFGDRANAEAQTRALIANGADVIFHAAGEAGLGVIETARRAGILAIGVDSNQNGVAPGTMLTSMLKRMDVAVFLALRDAHVGPWQARVRELGLNENGVGWALDQHNILLIDDTRHSKLVDLQFAVMAKTLPVYRYDEKTGCPYTTFPARRKAP